MPASVPLSVLDLARIRPDETPAEGFARSVRLAQTADTRGYTRLWFSEHHNMSNIQSSATPLLIQHVAAHSSNLRVGAGGIMLPNHSPLVIAEQFGTLATLFPGRIDLGLGRAPGTDGATVRALRRDGTEAGRFPSDVVELSGYITGNTRVPGVNAYPGVGTNVPLFILGSSLFGAQLAAQLGLPYVFASHFAPQELEKAARAYRVGFNPSPSLAGPDAKPYFIAAVNVIAADDADTAADQYNKAQLEWVRGSLGRNRELTDEEIEVLRDTREAQQALKMLDRTLVGTAPGVIEGLDALAEQVRADELMLVNLAVDEKHQHRTLELLAPETSP